MSTSSVNERVLMVLDDAEAAVHLLDTSCALAQLMRRELELVFVESAAALEAAALPMTRVLARAAQTWAPFAPEDVERGWRVQAARLRTLAERASARRPVHWSMRVMRGALAPAARSLREESDLLLVAAPPSRFETARRARRLSIVAFDDGTAGGEQAIQVASRLAHALGARLETRKLSTQPAVAGDGADLIVLPATALPALPLAELRAPLLLVGPLR